jgi:DNA polymerase-3 subunit delta'
MIAGQDKAVEAFRSAWASRRLHHAWLLAGPKGVGKATFAHAAATRVLTEAAGPPVDLPGLETPPGHPTARLLAAAQPSHFRWLERLERPTGGLARNISVDQVRSLRTLVTPSMSPRGDDVDDLKLRPMRCSRCSGTAGQYNLLPGQPCAGAIAADDPVTLLPPESAACDDAMTSPAAVIFPTKTQPLIEFADGSIGRHGDCRTRPIPSKARHWHIATGDADNSRRRVRAWAQGCRRALFRILELVPGLCPEALGPKATRGGGPRCHARARDQCRRALPSLTRRRPFSSWVPSSRRWRPRSHLGCQGHGC